MIKTNTIRGVATNKEMDAELDFILPRIGLSFSSFARLAMAGELVRIRKDLDLKDEDVNYKNEVTS